MALKAGRAGVSPLEVDKRGKLKINADIASVKGNIEKIGDVISSDKWNQLIAPFMYPTSTASGISRTVTGNAITLAGTASADAYISIVDLTGITKGHKFFIKLNELGSGAVPEVYIGNSSTVGTTGIELTEEGILEIPADYADTITGIYMKAVNTKVYNSTFMPIMIDVTEPYGSGNEPETVDEFRQIFSHDYYPYKQLGLLFSNRNLLDNGWFTINQRGQSSYSGNGYTVDRWKFNIGLSSVITVNNGGILYTKPISSDVYNGIQYYFEDTISIQGKQVTMSVWANGNIYATTFIFPTSGNDASPSDVEIDGVVWQIRIYASSDTHWLYFRNKSTEAISTQFRAIKLELGSVSTLANDTAPDTASELAKCQRYYHVYGTSAARPLNMYDCIPTMATTPSQGTITVSGNTLYYNSAESIFSNEVTETKKKTKKG